VLASSPGFKAASAFASDERVPDTGIGVAQLRLANLVQGDWLAGLGR
jgi:hypothetical protein